MRYNAPSEIPLMFDPLYQSLTGSYVKFSISRDWDAVEVKWGFFLRAKLANNYKTACEQIPNDGVRRLQ
jgi:hypothetical protein